MRVLLLVVVACAAGCLRTSAPAGEFGADAPADEFTTEQAKPLVCEAAGIPWNEFRRYSEDGWHHGNIRPPNGEPLTWVVFQFWLEDSGWRVHPSVFYLGTQINRWKIAGIMAGPGGTFRPYESMIHPEYITDCTCEVDGDTATGTVSFKAQEEYAGKVEYTARKKDGKWRIEQLRMPVLGITSTLRADGKWVTK
jgi:hypothetical protein